MFVTAALMLLASLLLAVAEEFTRASSIFTGVIVVCGLGWGMLLTERHDAARRMSALEELSEPKKRALR